MKASDSAVIFFLNIFSISLSDPNGGQALPEQRQIKSIYMQWSSAFVIASCPNRGENVRPHQGRVAFTIRFDSYSITSKALVAF